MAGVKDKFYLITGGNSGIGLAAAQSLIDAGAHVAIFGRNRATLDAALANLGDGNIAVAGDVSRLQDLDRLFSEIERTGRKLDGVFVNAGIANFTPIADVTETMFDDLMAVNLKGAYFTMQKALPTIKNGGAIVFTSTIGWHQGVPGYSFYGASKAALVGLANALAGELAPRGIRVNVVSPGAIGTPIVGRLGMPEEEAEGLFQLVGSRSMAGRVGTAAEVGQLVRFLLSDDASYINGAEIPVDGGYLLGKIG